MNLEYARYIVKYLRVTFVFHTIKNMEISEHENKTSNTISHI